MIVDAVAHALVGGTDTVAVRLVKDFQTSVEQPVAFSATVEGLLTRVLFPFKKGA